MSIAAMTWAFEQPLPPNQKIVLLALADCENGHSLICIPGQERIAEMATMSVRSVRRMLDALEDGGYITRERRVNPDGGGRKTDSYRLNRSPANLAGSGGATGQNEGGNRPTVAASQEPEVEPEVNSPTPLRESKVVKTLDGPRTEAEIDAAFGHFWQAYPRHIAKAKARAAFEKALTKARAATIVDAAREYRKHVGDSDPKFIAHPTTWLNGERWTDPVPVPRDRGAHQPEPPKPSAPVIPPGHRPVWNDAGYIIGSEPA